MGLGFVRDVVGLFTAIIGIVLGNEVPGVPGAGKKEEALKKINEVLNAPGGIDFPKMLEPIRQWLLGLFIDMAVGLLNKTGFFDKSSALS